MDRNMGQRARSTPIAAWLPQRMHQTLLVFIALLAAAARLPAQQPAARQPSAYEELQTFSAVLNHIRVNYIDSVTYTQLVRAPIDGGMQALDPHSRFQSHAHPHQARKLDRGRVALT